VNTSLPPNFMQQWQTTGRPSDPSKRHFSVTRDKIYLKKKPKQPFKWLWTKKCLRQIIVHVFKNLSNKKFYKWKSHMVRHRYGTKRSWYELGFHMVRNNSNNTATSIGTIAGCSDQRERNITTGLFGLGTKRLATVLVCNSILYGEEI
jgi:hypothetical protein